MLCHAVTLTFDLLTLNFYSTSGDLCIKIWAKSNNPWLSYWWFSTFSRGPNFTKLGKDIGRSSQHCIFVSDFGYLAVFSNTCGSNFSDVLNDAKFRTFDSLWKLGEEWMRSLGIHLMAIHCAAAERGGLISQKVFREGLFCDLHCMAAPLWPLVKLWRKYQYRVKLIKRSNRCNNIRCRWAAPSLLVRSTITTSAAGSSTL